MTDVQREPHDATHALEPTTEHGSHSHADHADHSGHADMFRRRFWWSLLLTVPVVVTSQMVMDWFGYQLDFTGIDWFGPVLGSVIFFWGGWPFLVRRVGGDPAHASPGMMLLIAMAISVAYVASLATTLGWFDLEFWWELAALVTIMLLGHWLEMKALGQAQSALAALAELLPDEAERVDADGGIDRSSTSTTLQRRRRRARASRWACPRRWHRSSTATAEFDESMVTGESRPVAKAVERPRGRRDRGDRFLDPGSSRRGRRRHRARRHPTPRRRGAGLAEPRAGARRPVRRAALLRRSGRWRCVTFIVWALAGDLDDAVVRTVTVLVIACPHALGLAIPLVISLSSALAAQAGILIKNRLALERMRTIDAVLFDKTGTLTKGEHVVTGIAGVDIGDDEVLRLAAAVEADSEHPLARAIVAAAAGRARSSVPATSAPSPAAASRPPSTAVATPSADRRCSASAQLIRADRTAPSSTDGWRSRGTAILYLVARRRSRRRARARRRDPPRSTRGRRRSSAQLGVASIMITGDAHQVAEAVGRELGVDEVMAEVLPEDKDAKVAELQAARPVRRHGR